MEEDDDGIFIYDNLFDYDHWDYIIFLIIFILIFSGAHNNKEKVLIEDPNKIVQCEEDPNFILIEIN